MYCTNCGKKLEEDMKFCPTCGTKKGTVNNNPPIDQNTKKLSDEDNKKANIMCVLSLVLTFGAGVIDKILIGIDIPAFKPLISLVAGGLPLMGLVLMIIVRAKYPSNTFGKIIMWLYIILYIIGMIFFAMLVIACGIAFRDCSV